MEFGKPWFVKETEKAFGLCFVILGRRRDRRRLYSKVNPANLNLRPDVDESSTEDTRSIRFDVNEEWIEKEVDEVTKPSPNQRLLRHLRILRRTTKTKHENDSRYQTEAYSETAEVWWIDLVWNVLGPIPELCTTQSLGPKHSIFWTGMPFRVVSKWHVASSVYCQCIKICYLLQYHLFLFTNIRNVCKTKHNLTFVW